MKILQLLRNPGSAVSLPPELIHFPASALLQPGKPFFVPGFSGDWIASALPALRVCKLGKNIDERFAPRYVDAIAPAVRFIPGELASLPDLQGLVSTIDSTVAVGPWQPMPADGTNLSLKWLDSEIGLSIAQLRIPQVISVLSRYMMLQMGDIILPITLPLTSPVKENDVVSLTLGNAEPFKIRIK